MASETIELSELVVEKNRYRVFWREYEQQVLREWWHNLDENHGARAQLRRCAKPEDVLLQPMFHALYQRLPKRNVLALAAVAGLVSHIKKSSALSFPAQLGKAKEGGDKPVMSELRFQQLLASCDLDELYESLRRAIMLLNGEGNILSIADGVLHFEQELRDKNQYTERPDQRFQFSWAKAYFSEIFKYTDNKK